MSSDSKSRRYARQIQFAPIGTEGNDQITRSRVAVLGCGALGTVAAEILARAGVGHLRLIDRDVVEWTNLQRQSLYIEQDAIDGRSKADAACDRLSDMNSEIEIVPTVDRAEVELVFDPPWNQSMMSEEARLEAGLL